MKGVRRLSVCLGEPWLGHKPGEAARSGNTDLDLRSGLLDGECILQEEQEESPKCVPEGRKDGKPRQRRAPLESRRLT